MTRPGTTDERQKKPSARLVLSLLALTLGGLGVIATLDAARPWRALQQDFLQREADTLRRLAEQPTDDPETLDALTDRLTEAQVRLASRQPEIEQLERELRQLDHKARRAAEQQRVASAAGDLEASRDARREVEALDELRAKRRADLEALHDPLHQARRELEAAQGPRLEASRRLDRLEATAWWRGLPWIGPFAKPIAVRQRVPQRIGAPAGGPVPVERCETCHLAVDRADLANRAAPGDWPAPLGLHPRRDLMVAEDSPHPVDAFGCVACHGGEGRATDFSRAGHQPRDPAQEADWKERLQYRPEVASLAPMVPQPLVQVGCGGCHTAPTGLAEAPTLSHGRRLRQQLGCDSCHRPSTSGPGEAPSPLGSLAPSLDRLAAKTTPALLAQRLASPDTHPGLEILTPPGGEDSETRATAETELRAVLTALWERSEPLDLPQSSQGRASRGRQLFDTLGCRACHTLSPGEEPAGQPTTSPVEDEPRSSSRPAIDPTIEPIAGPAVGPGQGRTVAWLAAFLLEPAAVEPSTRMPNPRLSATEAADLAAFLQAPPEADTRPLPTVDPTVRDRLLQTLLEHQGTLENAAAQFAGWDDAARTLALGQALLERRGCLGCHGAATQPRVADEPEAMQRPSQGPWSTASVEGLRHQAFRHPRLRFRLSAEEDRALRTVLLADTLPASAATPVRPAATPTQRLDRAARGEALVQRLGCRACHGSTDRPAPLAATQPPGAPGPPRLDGLGSKLRSDWLAAFLQNPGRFSVRPWLSVRMPRYSLSAEEIDLLIAALTPPETPWVTLEPPVVASRTRAVGQAVFELMQCDRCHASNSLETTGIVAPQAPAPSYRLARSRLRPEWVVEWILDPHAFDPATDMPTSFRSDAPHRFDSSFLVGSLETPMFRDQLYRLRRVFPDDQTMVAHLEDPRWVAEALRAHLWTLEKAPVEVPESP